MKPYCCHFQCNTYLNLELSCQYEILDYRSIVQTIIIIHKSICFGQQRSEL